jgi:hypothetical protein
MRHSVDSVAPRRTASPAETPCRSGVRTTSTRSWALAHRSPCRPFARAGGRGLVRPAGDGRPSARFAGGSGRSPSGSLSRARTSPARSRGCSRCPFPCPGRTAARRAEPSCDAPADRTQSWGTAAGDPSPDGPVPATVSAWAGASGAASAEVSAAASGAGSVAPSGRASAATSPSMSVQALTQVSAAPSGSDVVPVCPRAVSER